MISKLLKIFFKKSCKLLEYLVQVLICSKRLYGKKMLGVLVAFIITFAYTYYIIFQNRRILDLDETHRILQEHLKKHYLQEKGMGCKKPELDPFSPEAMKSVEKLPKITCEGTDWVTCNRSECSVTKEILQNMYDVRCTYRDILYVNDNLYFLSDKTKVRGGDKYILKQSDHVKVSCTAREKNGFGLISSRWDGLVAGFRPVYVKPIPPHRKDSYNVMVLAFDSASHNGFIRNMPKSYKYISEKATIMKGHNIVGDGTPAALFPILTGKPEEEHPDARKSISKKVYIDHKSFIFHLVKQYGYRTAYFEDSPEVGTFQYRFNGFRRQPADHYLRALLLEKANKIKLLSFIRKDYSDFCLGATPQYQVFLNLTEQFLQFDGKKFCFTFIADISHDNFNLISTADEAVVSFLESLDAKKVFEDTLVVIMGDHGTRYSESRQKYQGKLEERMPLMAIFLPEKLKQRRPDALKVLKQNSDVLTTHFDLHTTLLDVLDLKEKSNKYKVPGSDIPRAMSLLEPIPISRTCSEAGIAQHWCACTVWLKLSQSSPMYRQVANVLADYIDSLSEQQRSRCARRKLISIVSVLQHNVNENLLKYAYEKEEDAILGNPVLASPRAPTEYYQAQIILSPGRGVFEGTIMYNTKTDTFTMSMKDISRISAYGDEPKCISATHPHLNPFCYCNDMLTKLASESPSY